MKIFKIVSCVMVIGLLVGCGNKSIENKNTAIIEQQNVDKSSSEGIAIGSEFIVADTREYIVKESKDVKFLLHFEGDKEYLEVDGLTEEFLFAANKDYVGNFYFSGKYAGHFPEWWDADKTGYWRYNLDEKSSSNAYGYIRRDEERSDYKICVEEINNIINQGELTIVSGNFECNFDSYNGVLILNNENEVIAFVSTGDGEGISMKEVKDLNIIDSRVSQTEVEINIEYCGDDYDFDEYSIEDENPDLGLRVAKNANYYVEIAGERFNDAIDICLDNNMYIQLEDKVLFKIYTQEVVEDELNIDMESVNKVAHYTQGFTEFRCRVPRHSLEETIVTVIKALENYGLTIIDKPENVD